MRVQNDRALARCALFVLSASLTLPLLAAAQMKPQPEWKKGHKLRVKVDSAPQQAAIYINSRDYGIQGYTPSEFKLPKGTYKIILELPGWKGEERELEFKKSGAFTFTLVRQVRPAVLDLRAGSDQSALGGTISVDGAAVGTVPNRVEVAQGSHLIEVRRQGWNDWRDTVSVTEGEQRTMVVTLTEQVKPGSLLVTADVAGAEVFVDGQKRDTAPALVPDLAPGDHTVEVRKEAMPPWKQLVRVAAGQQTKVEANLKPEAPVVGSIKVLSATPMADVILDGEPKGPTNVEIKDIKPGSHLVEVRAVGYVSKRQEIDVRGGDMRVLGIDLVPAPVERKVAALRVISAEPEAEVFLDGASIGKVPAERKDLEPGKHFVTVRKPGFADYKFEAELVAGKQLDVAADLRASGSIKVLSQPQGAEVLLDGKPVGKTPLTVPEVAVGQHVVELKLFDFLDGKQQIQVSGGEEKLVESSLTPIQHGPTPEELDRRQTEQTSSGAVTLDRGRFTVDVGGGLFAYFFMARLTAGIARFGPVGIDIAAELRTSFVQTDVGLRPRVQLYRIDPIAVGVDLGLFGGGGPQRRDEFTFEVGAMLTFLAGSRVQLSLRPYFQFVTERLCPSTDQIRADDKDTGKGVVGAGDLYKSERTVCKTIDGTRTPPTGQAEIPAPDSSKWNVEEFKSKDPMTFGKPTFGQDPRERFSNGRLLLQLVLEVAVTKRLGIWALVEGVPYSNARQGFTGKFNILYLEQDFPLYARAGVTGKF